MDMCIVSLSIISPFLIADAIEAFIHIAKGAMGQGHLETHDFSFMTNLEVVEISPFFILNTNLYGILPTKKP